MEMLLVIPNRSELLAIPLVLLTMGIIFPGCNGRENRQLAYMKNSARNKLDSDTSVTKQIAKRGQVSIRGQ